MIDEENLLRSDMKWTLLQMFSHVLKKMPLILFELIGNELVMTFLG